MRYGYYLADRRATHGDEELALAARDRWNTLSLEKPLPFDGVSIWQREGTPPEIRIFCRDFFSGKAQVCQMMVTYKTSDAVSCIDSSLR